MFITFDREIIFMKFSQIVYNINEIMLNVKIIQMYAKVCKRETHVY